MEIPAFTALFLAIPVLFIGEWLVHRVKLFAYFNIPTPIAGGLLVALGVFALNVFGIMEISFATKVDYSWWSWWVTIEPKWLHDKPVVDASQPFMVAFFTCIGLNASWDLLKRGSYQVALFWGIALILAILQNVVGIGTALAIGESPLLGVLCGSAAMTGGHGTALGFADLLESLGLEGADSIAVAAATFGLVAGGLIGGPIGSFLVRKFKFKGDSDKNMHLEPGSTAPAGIIQDIGTLLAMGKHFFLHFLLVIVLVKLGAWVSYFIQMCGVTFPIYIGAMILGVGIRNVLEFSGKHWIDSETVDVIGSVMLSVFLAMALMSINLIELAEVALPMFIILMAQVALVLFFAVFVCFAFMGKDYEASVMSGGLCGFALGATPNAIANMKSLVEKFGPAPKAFLVIPIVGAFLIDFSNALNLTLFVNLVD